MIVDPVEHRCLGAIEFLDAVTGWRIREPLRVAGVGLRLQANASGLYVIRAAAGLEHHAEAFASPPAMPPFEDLSFELSVSDRTQRYLPRRATVKLPRKPAPTSDADSVLRPVAIRLYAGGARPVEVQWAVLRASVYVLEAGRRVGLANAWLSLQPALAGAATVSALTDTNGEALLAVTGVAPVRPAAGDDADPAVVYTRDFSATLRVVLHRDAMHRADARTPQPVANPDQIEDDIALGPPIVRILNPPLGALSAGGLQRVDVEVTP